ncbi:MAG: pyruvate dehydrogenase (acetyl-transferring), homodimeric type, partial [Endozoicomonas sp.]
PVIAASDYMSLYANQICEFVSGTFVALGTDGFGRSDSREQLRHFFEVDRHFIVVAALNALVQDGELKASVVSKAIKKFNIDPAKTNPLYS